MATPFLGSEEYDERAHRLYDQGDYDGALALLQEGLVLYPQAVELHVGLGYTRLAREEFAWARKAFEDALAIEPNHEEALVGLGDVLLRFGQHDAALECFERVRDNAGADDLELLLTMGRALYREEMFAEAHDVFSEAVALHPESAEAVAAVGYSLYRMGRESAARRELRRALKLDPQLHEARIFLGHLLYDRGNWPGALRHFERVPPEDHWDTLAVWRLIELKRALAGDGFDESELEPWQARLDALEGEVDPIDALLQEIAGGGEEDPGPTIHRVRMLDGQVYVGSWIDIVRQLRDAFGHPGESVAQFMRRRADEHEAKTGLAFPADDPESFVRASARAGLLFIEC